MTKLNELKVQNPKIDALREHLELIEKWETESKELLSLPIDSIPIEKLETLIDRAKFKYVVDFVSEVRAKLDYLEWKEEVRDVLEYSSRQVENVEESKTQEESKESQDKTPNKGSRK
mmetsp:Transcript_20617/g.23833  ORF Transcript_20617/g.23833 Transcript_20617/m.23833 type:complete len:117 (+) Transcript_20617:1174-1524(+)